VIYAECFSDLPASFAKGAEQGFLTDVIPICTSLQVKSFSGGLDNVIRVMTAF
jgi:hypothetical protein